MKTVGIITEYNPFHHGHQYQIQQLRQKHQADAVVVVMSGDFLQRGMPAWVDQYTRTRMALACGADFVFLLPAVYSTASAEAFAFGGVSILDGLGFVDEICFGSECGDIEALQQIANTIVDEKDHLELWIAPLLKQGMSYPAARESILKDEALCPDSANILKTYPELLKDSNNILAIEYLKAIRMINSSLKAITIQRKGSGYHSDDISGLFPSATAIRKACQKEKILPQDMLPEGALRILSDSFAPLYPDDFSDLVYVLLMNQEQMPDILDMTPKLWNRMKQLRTEFVTLSSWIDTIKTKQFTHSRISRVLCHLLLGITSNDLYDENQSYHPPAYARLLGFNPQKSALLRAQSELPIITKMADARLQVPSPIGIQHLHIDHKAHELYRYITKRVHNKEIPNDYHAGVQMKSSL